MSVEQTNKRVIRWVFLPLSVALLAIAGYVSAGPHSYEHGMGRHGGHNMMEKMLDHIDLDEQQEEKVEAIIETMKKDSDFTKGFSMIKGMIALNPDDANYLEAAEEQAGVAAEHMKQKVLAIAVARKDIYAILNDEQKEELNEVITRKMKRMGKRFSRD